MRDTVAISKALSDPSRVRILVALRAGELCGCQLVELLGLAASTVSKHMAVLRQADLVELRKEGRWAYYRRAGRTGPKSSLAALKWLDASVETDEVLQADAKRLGRILRTPVEELCKIQNRS
jgi:DNA-binding transcriptional ArsR family regulator